MHSFWLERVSTPVLHKMLDELRAGGNEVFKHNATTGECYGVIGSGVSAQVDYDAISQRARVMILGQPFFVPSSCIEGKVREALRVASGGV